MKLYLMMPFGKPRHTREEHIECYGDISKTALPHKRFSGRHLS
jgi:hypothetical protein